MSLFSVKLCLLTGVLYAILNISSNEQTLEYGSDSDEKESKVETKNSPPDSNEGNNGVFNEIHSLLLTKIDGELKEKVLRKIKDGQFSITSSILEEFSDDEKKELEVAVHEVFSPLIGTLLQELSNAGMSQNVSSLAPSFFANFSSEENEIEMPHLEKDEL